MRIIVNDADILIDVVELALLPNFFALEADFLTTSLVFEELEVEQQHELNDYIESGELKVKEMTLDQLSAIGIITFQFVQQFLRAVQIPPGASE